MSLLHMDGFDHYALADIALKGWQYFYPSDGFNTNPTLVAGAHGGAAVSFTNGTNGRSSTAMGVTVAPADTTFIVGFRYKHTGTHSDNGSGTTSDPTAAGTSGNSVLFYCRRSSAGVLTTQFWMRINPDGTLSAYRGTTLLGTTTLQIVIGGFAHIECKAVVDTGVAGSIELRIDGIVALNLSGINTAGSGSSGWHHLGIGRVYSNAHAQIYDDLYLLDGAGSRNNNFLGDQSIYTLFPTAAGTTSNFTRSTGADQWATIDETTANSDTDYNYSATSGQVDTLNFATAPVSGVTYNAIQVNMHARNSDAGPANLQAVVRHSGTDYPDGVDKGVGAAYTFVRQIIELNPGTSAPFTASDITSAEFGYKKTL